MGSLSVIVPIAVAIPSATFAGGLTNRRRAVKVSASSAKLSSTGFIVNDPSLSSASIVKVPLVES